MSLRNWLFFLSLIHIVLLNICFYTLMLSMIISSCSGHLIQVFSHRAQARSLLMLMRSWLGKHINFSCIFWSVSHACFLFFQGNDIKQSIVAIVFWSLYYSLTSLTIKHTVSLQGVCVNFLFFVKKAPFLGLLFLHLPDFRTYHLRATFVSRFLSQWLYEHFSMPMETVNLCSLKHVRIWDWKKREREREH